MSSLKADEVRWSKVNMRAMVLMSGKDLLFGKEEAVDETNASIMVAKKGREGQLGESSWAARRPLFSMPFFPPLQITRSVFTRPSSLSNCSSGNRLSAADCRRD